MKPFWVSRYEDDRPMTRQEWIQFNPPVDERGFWARLWDSRKLKFGWVGGLKGKPKVEVNMGTDF
jgi:hypothetical protein